MPILTVHLTTYIGLEADLEVFGDLPTDTERRHDESNYNRTKRNGTCAGTYGSIQIFRHLHGWSQCGEYIREHFRTRKERHIALSMAPGMAKMFCFAFSSPSSYRSKQLAILWPIVSASKVLKVLGVDIDTRNSTPTTTMRPGHHDSSSEDEL